MEIPKMHSLLWMLLGTMCCTVGASPEYLMGGHMDNTELSKSWLREMESSPSPARTAQLDDLDLDLDALESTVVSSASNDTDGPRYRPVFSFAFNGGQPFSLEKDPITGKIDFEKAPPVKALNYTEIEEEMDEEEISEEDDASYLERKSENKENEDISPNEINPYSPNFYDFLNLPVHYSSDKYAKDKYPLISSSYANTKVQSGSNSYSTYNHRPYHGETVFYYPTRKPYVTKTTASTTTMTTTTSPKTKATTTTVKPLTTTTSTTPNPTTVSQITTAFTTPSTSTERQTVASVSEMSPPITTWKPPFSSTVRYTTQSSDYKDILSMENFQMPMFHQQDQKGTNNIYLNVDAGTKFPSKNEEYADSYEEYEMVDSEEDKDYYAVTEATKEIIKNNTEPPAMSSTVSSSRTESTMAVTTTVTSTTTEPPQSIATTGLIPQESIIINNPLQFQVLPQRPIAPSPSETNNRRGPQPFENVDNRRNELSNIPLIGANYRPNPSMHQHSGSINNGVLIESSSNIIIPPDQDTVSFVLGNRQNLEGGYYSLGTAIGENPYNGPSGMQASFKPVYGSMIAPENTGNYDSQADKKGTMVLPLASVIDNKSNYNQGNWHLSAPSSVQTAPAAQKLVNEVDTSVLQGSSIKGTITFEQQEDKKEENKDSNYVVFPTTEDNKYPVEEHVVIINEADGSIREIPMASTTMKPPMESSLEIGSKIVPQPAENLTPPAERPRPPPPFYYQYHYGGSSRPEHPRPQRIPVPSRGKQPPLLPTSAEQMSIRRRPPYTPDSNLPNILPQFRPNAKTSHGHRGVDAIGTIPASQSYPTRMRPPLQPPHPLPPTRRPILPPPSYLQRLNPPPPPIHSLRLAAPVPPKSDGVLLSRDPEPAVKRFRLPTAIATSRGEDEAKSVQVNHAASQNAQLKEDNKIDRYSEEPPQLPPRPPLYPKRRTADSPVVATLQMIQQHGEFQEEPIDSNSPILSHGETIQEEPEAIIAGEEIHRRTSDNRDVLPDPPVYVVYPVNTAVNIHPDDSSEKDESVVVGTRGPQRPLPPETLLQDNTEQEMGNEENVSLHSLFNSRLPVVSDFPYPLERPDSLVFTGGLRETPLLVPSDQRQTDNAVIIKDKNQDKDDVDTSVNVIPYLQDYVPFQQKKNDNVISATLHRLPGPASSTPIAYAYTPHAETSHRLTEDIRNDEIDTIDRSDQKPVLLPSQQPSSSSSSAPSPQNFMAPFVASLSAEAPSKNGWSVVVVEPNIERKSDDGRENLGESSDNDTYPTEKPDFDVENFKPQLFGGFKPIYEFPTEQDERSGHLEVNNSDTEMPLAPQKTDDTTV